MRARVEVESADGVFILPVSGASKFKFTNQRCRQIPKSSTWLENAFFRSRPNMGFDLGGAVSLEYLLTFFCT